MLQRNKIRVKRKHLWLVRMHGQWFAVRGFVVGIGGVDVVEWCKRSSVRKEKVTYLFK